MENVTGKVIVVDGINKVAHIAVDRGRVLKNVYRMYFGSKGERVEVGNIVEATPLRIDADGWMVCDLINVLENHVPEWLYKDGEQVSARYPDGEMHPETFVIINHSYQENEGYFWCHLQSTLSEAGFDAIASNEKGEPFSLVMQKLVAGRSNG